MSPVIMEPKQLWIESLTKMSDDPEIYDGAHVAVQLVARRLQEEKCLALAEHIGDALPRP